MQIQSAYAAGVQGLQRASAGITEETVNLNRQAQQTRQQEQDVAVQLAQESQPAPRPAPDTTESLVRLEQQQLSAQANVRSIRTADEMLGSIIDVRV